MEVTAALALFFVSIFGAVCFVGGYVRGKETAERKALLGRLEELLIAREAIAGLRHLRPYASAFQPKDCK